MKRHGNLWGQIVDLENIKYAHKMARRGKSYYTEVKMIDADVDKYAKEIQQLLINKTFTTAPYEIQERHDGRKMRTIYKLPYYPDRIVQHALLSVIGPILTRSFIRDTFQSIEGRGTSDAMRRVKQLVQSDRCPTYALKVDVKKYYPSVCNEQLKTQVRKKIKCQNTLWLLDNIIDSMNGLPIGNYTSQHLGNLYLNSFDWWMKQQIKPSGYFRYCDDIVVLHDSREELKKIQEKMAERLQDLGLSLKPTWRIYNVEHDGLDFVGYVFRPNNTRLRPSIADKFRATCKCLQSKAHQWGAESSRSQLMAYKGWLKPANAKRLWRAHTQKLMELFPKQLRGAI